MCTWKWKEISWNWFTSLVDFTRFLQISFFRVFSENVNLWKFREIVFTPQFSIFSLCKSIEEKSLWTIYGTISFRALNKSLLTKVHCNNWNFYGYRTDQSYFIVIDRKNWSAPSLWCLGVLNFFLSNFLWQSAFKHNVNITKFNSHYFEQNCTLKV